MAAEHSSSPADFPTEPLNVVGVRKVALAAAVVGFAAFGILGGINVGADEEHGVRDFFLTYLVGFVYWFSLPFGSAALLMVAYLTSASWGVVLRRLFQAATRTWWFMALLGVPVIVGVMIDGGHQAPYWWADHSWEGEAAVVAQSKDIPVEAAEEAQHKIHDYLNGPFFIGRYIAYFAILGVLITFLNRWGKRSEDSDDESAKASLKGLSGPGVLIWALLMTFFATDWVMSIEPTWASSMFPVIFGMNQFLTTFAFCVLLFYSLNKGNMNVLAIVKDKFRIDIGSLMLGFTMIWAYASFCQYMLIWAGNLPEELTYYLKRGAGEDNAWVYLAYFLMLFHWFIPFIVLLFREVKLVPSRMQWMTSLLLVVCAADVIWWLVPAVPHEKGYLHVPMAIAAIVGVGGLWGIFFCRELSKAPVLPANSEGKFLATWGEHH